MTKAAIDAAQPQGNKENDPKSNNDEHLVSKHNTSDAPLPTGRNNDGSSTSSDRRKSRKSNRRRRDRRNRSKNRSRSSSRKRNGESILKKNERNGADNDGKPTKSNQNDSSNRPAAMNRHQDSCDITRTNSKGYQVVHQPKDAKLGSIQDDPRGNDPTRRITKKASSRGNGRNTESFDPASTLVRPDLRVHVGSNSLEKFDKPLKHDDVVIVPELFGKQDDWSLYYRLVEEMTALQKEGNKGSEWISWHEGAHLICKNPKGSKTFCEIIDRLCQYFGIAKKSIGTRFNWYRDSSDWKPFHHDSAAFNPQRAKNQNITVGVSFGATRELAFVRAGQHSKDEDKVKIYFPQTNNGVFSFGRDANILWKHGINALHPDEQDGKGRISIILWGLAETVIEEEGSPPMLGSDGQGPHAQKDNRRNGRRNGNRRRFQQK